MGDNPLLWEQSFVSAFRNPNAITAEGMPHTLLSVERVGSFIWYTSSTGTVPGKSGSHVWP